MVAQNSAQLTHSVSNIQDEIGINLRELSLLTGIRYASLNELKNDKKVTLNLQHVLAVMVALRIPNIGDLFEFQIDDNDIEEKSKFHQDSSLYRTNGLPEKEFDKIKENAFRLNREDELRK